MNVSLGYRQSTFPRVVHILWSVTAMSLQGLSMSSGMQPNMVVSSLSIIYHKPVSSSRSIPFRSLLYNLLIDPWKSTTLHLPPHRPHTYLAFYTLNSWMTHLKFESYVFDPRPRYPLVTTAKRYWHPQFYSEDPDASTLIFAHGTGFHKEQWEPTLEYLYDISSRNGGMKIREAWSIDCPNHGDAVVLNEEELSWGYRQCTCLISSFIPSEELVKT